MSGLFQLLSCSSLLTIDTPKLLTLSHEMFQYLFKRKSMMNINSQIAAVFVSIYLTDILKYLYFLGILFYRIRISHDDGSLNMQMFLIVIIEIS